MDAYRTLLRTVNDAPSMIHLLRCVDSNLQGTVPQALLVLVMSYNHNTVVIWACYRADVSLECA